MIDCQVCGNVSIGNLEEPICVVPSDSGEFPDETVCKSCFERIVGRSPRDDEQEYDPEDVPSENFYG